MGLEALTVLLAMEECRITKLEAWEDTRIKEEAMGRTIIITLTTAHRCPVKREGENVTRAQSNDLSLS